MAEILDLLQTSEVGTFILDREFRVVWVNRAMMNYFGVPSEDVIGQDKRHLVKTRFKQVFADPDHFADRVLSTYADNTYRERFEARIVSDTGREERWIEHWSQPISSGPYTGGRIEHYYDITERKAVEQALASARVELEQRVKERTANLERLNSELESFNYSVSHDLRAPLRGINGFSKVLEKDYAEALDETAKGYLRRIQAGAERMGNLIDDLLDLSRLSTTPMACQSVDLSQLARQVVDTLRATETWRQVEVLVQPGMSATGDRGLWKIALENLLQNAWKFTRKRADAQIEVGSIEEGDSQVFFVRDNGVGFDEAYADKLFKAFQRLHLSSEFSGTGIGLAIVQRVVLRHNGRIWASSRDNAGATFYFTSGNP